MLNNEKFILSKADKDLFAVYQTIYSNADIEMWYDWNARLNDTKWTENCYWIMSGERKTAGVIVNENTVMFPFLVKPFCDRNVFWDFIHRHMQKAVDTEIHINGVLDEDVQILLTLGYKVNRIRQMMCRPTDIYHYEVPIDFYYRTPKIENDLALISQGLSQGYAGGIDYEVFGIPEAHEIQEDVKRIMNSYLLTNSLNQSIIVLHKGTDEIAGICLAGVDSNMPNKFSGIAEICVIPKFRNCGLAKFMLEHSITIAHEMTPVIKLCVTVGNSAESIYRKMGFISGPKFTNMSFKRLVKDDARLQ